MCLISAIALGFLGQNAPIVITHSGNFAPPPLTLPSADVDHAAIVIRGNNLTVDFGNRVLRGTPDDTDPDQRKGLAIQVEGNNVTIKHAKVRGYHIAVLARKTTGLKVQDCDFSYNWKQHLKSTPEKEDGADWMFYHKNDHDEWLHGRPDEGIPAYAGAIYLTGCDNFEVKNVKVTGGENGLMLTECTKGLVWNNDFSFLSALGIGMYRSSDNRVMHNKIDWCVRGYSHGVYNRGQDSAGILIYEQSNRNTFAYNSVTHGGDGFFLWAGQSTMDNGVGGCNDNLVYGNDFSHAPTNGIEATFSRNFFLNNKVLECWHGVWGGYSFDTKIQGNAFGLNAEAIAIEHGQNNAITQNTFWRDNDGIDLWQNKSQDPNWGYPKHRDTKSHGYRIEDNYFGNIPGTVFKIRATTDVTITKNRIERFGNLAREDEPNPNFRLEGNRLTTDRDDVKTKYGVTNTVVIDAGSKPTPSTMQPSGNPVLGLDPDRQAYINRFDVTWDPYASGDPRRKEIEALAPQPLKGGMDPFLKKDALRGRRYIVVDEWGPYDFRHPVLVPVEGAKSKRYEIWGPRGTWRATTVKGATLSESSGSVPGFVEITPSSTGAGSIDIELEYKGGATTDYRGIVTPAGKSVAFGFHKFNAAIDWHVQFFKWTESENPAEVHANPKNIAQVFKTKPIKEANVTELDYSGPSFTTGLPNDHYATLAEGTFTVPAGSYRVEMTTDDGARVWVDGLEVIADAWKYQGPTGYSADLKLDGSKHRIRVEHFQIDGYAALKVKLVPAGK